MFKPLGGLRPPRGLNKKAEGKYPLSISYGSPDALLLSRAKYAGSKRLKSKRRSLTPVNRPARTLVSCSSK